MGERTAIEWTDASWTPIRARNTATGKVGWHCEHVTAGCEHCYAEGINERLGTGLPFKPGHRKDLELFLDDKMLTAPLRWRKPRMVFVCSMTDLFAEFVPDEWIDRVLAVMALAPQHVFQVLTKRPKRMRRYMTTPDRKRTIAECVLDVSDLVARIAGTWKARPSLDHFSECFAGSGPFPNVWAGTSCEDQATANERIPHLLATPAAVRFVSAEPLLGAIDLTRLTFTGREHWIMNALDFDNALVASQPGQRPLDWVIVGGESGPKARPFDLAWARSIVAQCRDAGVACFVKQVGAHVIQDGERRRKRDKKGGDWSEWPHDLRVREFPNAA